MNQYIGGAIGLAVIFLLVQLLALWRVFEKAGEQGWKTLVPFYNWYVFFKIVGKPGWWLLVMFIPLIIPAFLLINSNPPIYNHLSSFLDQPILWKLGFFIPIFISMIYIIWSFNMLSKSFGKSEGFTAGLMLAGFIFLPLLGFGDDKYLGPYDDKKEVVGEHPVSDYDLV